MKTADQFRLDKPLAHRALRVPIPATRDPFVNTPLVRVSRDAEDYRIYRFSVEHSGLYIVQDDSLYLLRRQEIVVVDKYI